MKKIIAKNAREVIGSIRDVFHRLTQSTYPFVEYDADGNPVYLDVAYQQRYKLCQARLGVMPHIKCGRIFFWTEFLHLWVGVLFWALAIVIHYYAGRPWSLILPIIVLAYLTFQELFLDRMLYNQSWLTGLIDWLVWGIPLILFIFISFF